MFRGLSLSGNLSSMYRLVISVFLILAVGGVTGVAAEFPDWDRYSGVEVIDVLTFDEDGDLRQTPVWFVLLSGEAYLRTGNSRWLANLRRDPNLRLEIQSQRYEARAEEIVDDALVGKVDIAADRKYGLQDRLIRLFRTSSPRIVRLYPRPDGGN